MSLSRKPLGFMIQGVCAFYCWNLDRKGSEAPEEHVY